MQKIILRHLSGSKANTVQELTANPNLDVTFGREDGVQVKYDPTRDMDDLVSRQHAKIGQDASDPNSYFIEDLGSRNGTFLNKQRLSGRANIAPGDHVQFGPGGPEFEFDLDPRPSVPARTREASVADMSRSAVVAPATRESSIVDPSATSSTAPPPATGEPVKATVGKATVERMIGDTKKQGQKTTLFVGLGAAGLVALVGGLLLMRSMGSERAAQDEANKTKVAMADAQATATAEREADRKAQEEKDAAALAAAPMTPTAIAAANANSTARIDVVWQLTYDRAQVYQEFRPNKDPKTGQPLVNDNRKEIAVFIQLPGGSIEPQLTKAQNNHPIGGAHMGSAFVISSNGFMLTNRHVAATWLTSYQFPPDAATGILIGLDGKESLTQAPRDWVPAASKQTGRNFDSNFVGDNVYIAATFPGSQTPTPVTSWRPSVRHDVAMLTIASMGNLDKVEINDNYDSIKQGDAQIVMGYPAVSPPVFGVVRSRDVFNQTSKEVEIPDPTLSVGNVGRIFRDGGDTLKMKDPAFSSFGDSYQLTINSTGSGNSGGPVFDDQRPRHRHLLRRKTGRSGHQNFVRRADSLWHGTDERLGAQSRRGQRGEQNRR